MKTERMVYEYVVTGVTETGVVLWGIAMHYGASYVRKILVENFGAVDERVIPMSDFIYNELDAYNDGVSLRALLDNRDKINQLVDEMRRIRRFDEPMIWLKL